MTKKIILSTVTATLLAVGFSGCMGNPYQLTPEQQAQADEMRGLMMAKLKQQLQSGGYNAPQTQTEEKAIPVVQVPTITQEELKSKIEAFGVASSYVKIERTKTGININGKPLSDYEGSIKQVGFNTANGNVTYLVQTALDTYLMKFLQATSNSEPLVVASVTFKDGTWHISSVTGKKLSGDTLTLGSSGFVITRADGSGFTYEHTTGIKTINVPEGYEVAKYQNGDIVGTKTILLEIPAPTKEEDGGFGSAWSKMKTLGATLGMGKKQDYAFLNLDNGNLSKINISSDGKSTTQCLQYGERINKFVVKCLKYADPVESLYSVKDGSRNKSHYYWKINWVNSKSGPIGFTQEEGLKNIYATNLHTGKKVLLASRALGFVQFDIEVQNDGKINMIASNGPFGSEIVEDVESKIETLPAVVEEKEEK